ncbi:galactosyl transferase [Ascodesmis nigricans]|uniref:Galactosyl transferase n=1 Tax=Ascodesmis nigricans TaxID=341454 RepID=A0A4S2MHJ3_9PEZI|nr:galactosyl transferase [Ascodesmis nigricans]
MHLPTFDVPDVPLATAPKPHQIAILTASDGGGHNGGIPNIIAQAMTNRNAYARLHGYHHQFINISSYDVSGAHAVWKKIPAIIDCFRLNPEVQWIWWLDLDAIIMNSDIDLTEYLLSPEAMDKVLEKDTDYVRGLRKLGLKTPKKYDLANIDLLVSNDLNGLNAGSFFIRRSAFTQILLRLWIDPLYMFQPWEGREQEVLAHLINSHDWIRSHVGWVKQKWINAYAFGGDDGWQWTKDCVVVHFAGCWVDGMDACKSRWNEFMGKADQKLRVDERGNPVVRGLQGVGNEHVDY